MTKQTKLLLNITTLNISVIGETFKKLAKIKHH